MALRDYSTKRDVTNWLPHVLERETFYEDGAPSWVGAESNKDAIDKRIKLIKSLQRKPKKTALKWLITRLKDCEPRQRCYSGACPECTRALQRFFASEISRSSTPMCCISIAAHTVLPDQLQHTDLRAIRARMKRLLKKSEINYAVGGVDISFNTERPNPTVGDHWSLHIWAFVPSARRNIWEPSLRKSFGNDGSSSRPVWISDFDGELNAAAYALKNVFFKREAYYDHKGPEQRFRVCRNARYQKLPLIRQKQLAHYLDKSGLGRRLILLDARVYRDIGKSPYISGLYER